MRKIIFIMLFAVFVIKSNGQTIAEWTQQKKIQIKYLEQQIGAMQMYIGYARKGYHFVHNGLSAIGDIKKGDFNLNSDYFNSLKIINPSVKQCSKIANIIALELGMVKIYKITFQKAVQSDQFTQNEIGYIRNVFTNLLNDSFNNINELMDILQPGKFEMKDDERIRRIDFIYEDMQEKNAFAEHFSNESNLLAVQRLKEKSEVENSRLLNDIKK